MKRTTRALAGVAIIGIAAWCARGPMLRGYARWLNVGQPLTSPVDLVYVLGGGAETRPLVAAAILKLGFADRALIPNPAPTEPLGPRDLRESDLIRGMLASEGIDASMVTIVELPEASTDGEMRALRDYLLSHPDSTAAIVTDDFHTRRCNWLLDRYFGSVAKQRVTLVACPTDGYGSDDWWHHPDGLQLYLLESVKLVREAFR